MLETSRKSSQGDLLVTVIAQSNIAPRADTYVSNNESFIETFIQCVRNRLVRRVLFLESVELDARARASSAGPIKAPFFRLPTRHAAAVYDYMHASCLARPRTYTRSTAIAQLGLRARNYCAAMRMYPALVVRRFERGFSRPAESRTEEVGIEKNCFLSFFFSFRSKIDSSVRFPRARLFEQSQSVVVTDGAEKVKAICSPYYDQFPRYHWRSHDRFSPPLAVNYSVHKHRT